MEKAQMINLVLEYIWVPIIIPVVVRIVKFVFSDKFLYVKEIKETTAPEIGEFIELYNRRIKDELRISAEEILLFVKNSKNESIEHHLYVCKKLNKTVGFIKFMVSRRFKYIFIAYVAIDDTDKTANCYGLNVMLKKISKKYFKPQIATHVITETELSTNGFHITALNRLIARYATNMKKQCYYVDFDYIQPSMPDDELNEINEMFLSLIYIPYYTLDNDIISKKELIEYIQSIYFEIYCPSCNDVSSCNVNEYNSYLTSMMEIYRQDLPDYIKLIKISN